MPARHSPHVVRFALLKYGGGSQKAGFYGGHQTHILTVSSIFHAGDRMIHARNPEIGFRTDLCFFRNPRDNHPLCHASRWLGSRGLARLWWNTRLFHGVNSPATEHFQTTTAWTI